MDASAPGSSFRRRNPGWPAIFVWSALLAMFVLACRFVALYASPFPRWDDLEWVKALRPGSDLDLQWLWSSHNEHRIPLPRLFGVSIARSVGDIRAVMFFGLGLSAASAAALIVVARRLRGSSALADAVFPLLFLTPVAGTVFLCLHGISFLLPIALLVSVLVSIAAKQDAPGPASSLWIGTASTLLPLCGGPGLTTVPPLLAWMAVVGALQRRSTDARARLAGNILLASAVASAALIAVYFVGFELAEGDTRNLRFGNLLLQAWKFLALGLGPAASSAWPWSGAAVLIVAVLEVVALTRAWSNDPRERIRIAGLAASGLSIATMGLAIGFSRGSPTVEAGFHSRYVPAPALWWCAAYIALVLYAPPRLARGVGLGMLAVLLALLPAHLESMREEGHRSRAISDAFCVDVAQELDEAELVDRHWWRYHWGRESFAGHLHTLRESAMWPPLVAFAKRSVETEDGRRVSPTRIRSEQPASLRFVEDENVLLVPAECALEYARVPGAGRLEGRLGIPAPGEGQSGEQIVQFTVEIVLPGTPTRVLFDRTLRPSRTVGDRGFQSFSVELPAADWETLILRTTAPDPGDSPRAFWCDIRMR